MRSEPATEPSGARRSGSPPPARVPGNLWTEIAAPQPGAFVPDQRVSVIVAGEDPEGLAPLTLAALSGQSYPAALCEVVLAADPGAARSTLPRELELSVVDPAPEARAAERARGELILFLEPGAIPERGLVEAHARWHHAVSDAVSVGRSRAVSASSLAPEEVAEAARRDELEALFAERLRPDPAEQALEAYLELTRGLTERRADLFRVAARTNVALRRETWSAAGRGPELPDRSLARLDLAYRLERAGCLFVPERAAVSFNHYPEPELALAGALGPEGPPGFPDPRAESLIPIPGFRRPGAGRRFLRPALVVHLSAGEEPAAEVIETVDAVLRGRLSDLELRLELPPAHPERALVEEACAADPRIVVAADGGAEAAESPFEATLPALAVPDERTFEDLQQLMLEEGVGALHVTVPGRIGRLLPARLLKALWRGPTVEVVATGPLARARRIAAAAPAEGRPDPAVVLGELFGERWVSGVEVSLRRRGAPEPQVTEHGPLAPATDLERERAQRLRHRSRADVLQARAERYAERAVRERVRARAERERAFRLKERIARTEASRSYALLRPLRRAGGLVRRVLRR